MAQTVASKGELVCSDAKADITNVESLLAVVGSTGVYIEVSMIFSASVGAEHTSVRNRHLAERKPVKDISLVIHDAIYDQTITGVKSNSEIPFLPMHRISIDAK